MTMILNVLVRTSGCWHSKQAGVADAWRGGAFANRLGRKKILTFLNCGITKIQIHQIDKCSEVLAISKLKETLHKLRMLFSVNLICKKVSPKKMQKKCAKNVKNCPNLSCSCFPITLIKCLEGHRSLGSLFNVKICSKLKSGHSLKEWVIWSKRF